MPPSPSPGCPGTYFSELVVPSRRKARVAIGAARGVELPKGARKVAAVERDEVVAAHFNALGIGVGDLLGHRVQVGAAVVLEVESRAEGKDEHLKADLLHAVNRRCKAGAHNVRGVEKDGVFHGVGRKQLRHAPPRQALALNVAVVVEEEQTAVAREVATPRPEVQAGGLAVAAEDGLDGTKVLAVAIGIVAGNG